MKQILWTVVNMNHMSVHSVQDDVKGYSEVLN